MSPETLHLTGTLALVALLLFVYVPLKGTNMPDLTLSGKQKAVVAFLAPVLIGGLTMLIMGTFDREVFAVALGTALTSSVGVYLTSNEPKPRDPNLRA